jgi:hypothetical protein
MIVNGHGLMRTTFYYGSESQSPMPQTTILERPQPTTTPIALLDRSANIAQRATSKAATLASSPRSCAVSTQICSMAFCSNKGQRKFLTVTSRKNGSYRAARPVVLSPSKGERGASMEPRDGKMERTSSRRRHVTNLCAYEYTPPSVNTMIIEQLSNYSFEET